MGPSSIRTIETGACNVRITRAEKALRSKKVSKEGKWGNERTSKSPSRTPEACPCKFPDIITTGASQAWKYFILLAVPFRII